MNTAFLTAFEAAALLLPPLLLGCYVTWALWPRGRRLRPFKPICTTRLLMEEEDR